LFPIVGFVYIAAVSSPAWAEPLSFPLFHVEVGQDGEDIAAGIHDYYAHSEAYMMVFPHQPGDQDRHGRALAPSVKIRFEEALHAEMYDIDGAEPVDGLREFDPIEAPGAGWIIERTFHTPWSNIIILTASLGENRERLEFYRIAIGEALTRIARIDIQRDPGPHQLADGWWNLEMRPAAIGWRTSPDRDKPYGPRIFFDAVPAALHGVFPPDQGFDDDEGWWRDGVRDEHLHDLEHIHRAVWDALSILEGPSSEPARRLLARYHDDQFATPDPETILGEWKVRSMQPDGSGGVIVYPWFDAVIGVDYGEVFFRKLSGSQRRSGRLFRDFGHLSQNAGLVFLGSRTIGDEPAPVYSGWLLYDLPEPDTDTFGRLYALADDHVVMVFDAVDASQWELYELKRTAGDGPGGGHPVNAAAMANEPEASNDAGDAASVLVTAQDFNWLLESTHKYLDLGLYFHPLWNRHARQSLFDCLNEGTGAQDWLVRTGDCLGQLGIADSDPDWIFTIAQAFAARMRVVEAIGSDSRRQALQGPWLEVLVAADDYLDNGLLAKGQIPGREAYLDCASQPVDSPDARRKIHKFTTASAIECLKHIPLEDSDPDWRATVAMRVDRELRGKKLIEQAIPNDIDARDQRVWRQLLRRADDYLDLGLAGDSSRAWTQPLADCARRQAPRVGLSSGEAGVAPRVADGSMLIDCLALVPHEDSDPDWRSTVVEQFLEPVLELGQLGAWVPPRNAAFWWSLVQQAHRYLDNGLSIDDEEKASQLHTCAEEIDDPIGNPRATTTCLKRLGIEDSDPDWPETVVDLVVEQYDEKLNVPGWDRFR